MHPLGNIPPSLTVGQLARELGIPRRRVKWWLERGFLRCDRVGHGPGKWWRVPQDELDVARRALAVMSQYEVKASDGLFERARQAA